MSMLETLKELIYVPGISGYEDGMREFIKDRLGSGVRTEVDNLGNLIVPLSKGPRSIVLMAHMDEIGMVVTKLEDDGSLRFRKVGGIDDRTLAGRMVEIKTAKGIVPGVIGMKPIHLMADRSETQKTIPAEDLFIDIGARDKKEAKTLGVKMLDPVVLKKDFMVMNKKYVSARGLDDRCGCAVLLDVFERLKKEKFKQGVTIVFSVQEEVGLRGARAIANTLHPDYIFAIDSMSSTDGLGIPKITEPVILGHGPALRVIDNLAMASPVLREYLLALAKKKRIPIQIGVTGGTTDGAAVQECGSAMMPLAFPLRYTHTPVEVIHLDDLENLSRLVVEAVKGL
jgi:putative aminopeptidase FrvX